MTHHMTPVRMRALLKATGIGVGAALVLAGCSMTPPAAEGSDELTMIGYSVLGQGGGHWLRMIDETTKAGEAAGIEVRISDPQFDAVTQVNQVQDLITAGAQVLIIAALDQEAIGVAVEEAHAKGIKVIADLSGFEGADAYVGINECDRGTKVGEYIAEWWLENRDDAPMVFESNADSLGGSLPDRTDCMYAAIEAGVPGTTLVADLEAWQEEDGYNAMSDALTANPQINLVLGSNNEGTWGHVAAAEAAGRTPGTDIFFATVDGQERTLKLIDEGKVLVGDRIPQEVEGPLLIKTAKGLFDGSIEPGQTFTVDTSVITSENVASELAAIGK